jgi:hypothetical protein
MPFGKHASPCMYSRAIERPQIRGCIQTFQVMSKQAGLASVALSLMDAGELAIQQIFDVLLEHDSSIEKGALVKLQSTCLKVFRHTTAETERKGAAVDLERQHAMQIKQVEDIASNLRNDLIQCKVKLESAEARGEISRQEAMALQQVRRRPV